MTAIVGQETWWRQSVRSGRTGGFNQRDKEDTVMLLQQRPPAKRGETVRQVARRWPGPTIQLAEL
jgi:hypothetical protein